MKNKQILISHRGNIVEKKVKLENKPSYIDKALNLGYDCEIDVRYYKGWYLGHDRYSYKISLDWLKKRAPKLWVHCKESNALYQLNKLKYNNINYFWHNKDDYTLTSKGYIWIYPYIKIIKNCICNKPEIGYMGKLSDAMGICSDNIIKYKK